MSEIIQTIGINCIFSAALFRDEQMNSKHRRTLKAIFESPVRSNISWRDIESMLVSLGAVVEEAEGSRIWIMLNDVAAVFHRPHPHKETDKGAVKSMRRFLSEAGVEP